MNDQLKSQLAGLGLAFMTAIGCIAYERLVKSHSYSVVGALVSLHYIPFWLYSFLFVKAEPNWNGLLSQKLWVVLFLVSGVTGPLWYVITRKQSVVIGAIYEVKYIAMMAIIYLVLGTTKFTWNVLIGLALAMCSVYFISK